VSDIDDLDRALDRAVNLKTFLKADRRVERVAAFVADHFRENVAPLGYKAFLVAVDREACAKYKRALDQHLPPEVSQVIYTKSPNDVVERPLVAELQLSDDAEKSVRKEFPKPETQPQILIVTDKLLTGYDAPILYCMYLDKLNLSERATHMPQIPPARVFLISWPLQPEFAAFSLWPAPDFSRELIAFPDGASSNRAVSSWASWRDGVRMISLRPRAVATCTTHIGGESRQPTAPTNPELRSRNGGNCCPAERTSQPAPATPAEKKPRSGSRRRSITDAE
jgi:hypothetical protein